MINGKEVGINPMTIYPDMAKPTDSIPTMRKNCMVQAVSTPQLISANYLSSAAVLISIQNILDDGDVFDEIQFDVRKSKMIPGTKVNLQGT